MPPMPHGMPHGMHGMPPTPPMSTGMPTSIVSTSACQPRPLFPAAAAAQVRLEHPVYGRKLCDNSTQVDAILILLTKTFNVFFLWKSYFSVN